VQIPLDYYRILGLPVQATPDQVLQAHRDRAMQMPRQDYSESAIAARKFLLDEAHAVLCDPERRKKYNSTFLPQALELPTHEDSDVSSAASALQLPLQASPPPPSIEVANEHVSGALLILLELGEYELILSLGQPYCSSVGIKGLQVSQPSVALADITLTVSQACLEIGREQWKQRQYEAAASSLSTGLRLLQGQEGFSDLKHDIEDDLFRLRPYRILELVALPLDAKKERQQGLYLLQMMLDERQGIEGRENDHSGLDTDDFLRFIQQLRDYLTTTEQQNLFEAEAQRPSAVSTYLLVYALLAQGFSQKRPELIQRAQQYLVPLQHRQDIHLEQSVCALLLGQPTAALQSLQQSQEDDTRQFIQSHSQGDPDLLPGLCLYCEQWFQQDVFPHFRDLVHQPVSLQTYFEDAAVQAYLDALLDGNPAPAATGTAHARSKWTHPTPQKRMDSSERLDRAFQYSPEALPVTSQSAMVSTVPASISSQDLVAVGGDIGLERFASNSASVSTLERRTSSTATNGHSTALLAQNHAEFDSAQLYQNGKGAITPSARSATSIKRRFPSQLSPAMLLGIGILSLGALCFLAFRQLFPVPEEPSLHGEQLQIALEEPPLEIPQPTQASVDRRSPITSETLTKENAQKIVETWLAAKAAAMGPQNDVKGLSLILTEPILAYWQEQAQSARQDGWHRTYEHSLTADSLIVKSLSANMAHIEVEVREKAQTYTGNQLNTEGGYDDVLRVRYQLIRSADQWRIKDVQVVQ
jgi:hypothetical protein